jgi:hypothetical protein
MCGLHRRRFSKDGLQGYYIIQENKICPDSSSVKAPLILKNYVKYAKTHLLKK